MVEHGGKLKGTNWINIRKIGPSRPSSLYFAWPSDITWSQWPTAASASSCASASLASISSDRSRCALAEPDWHRMWVWEAMPCWEKPFNLPHICRTFSRLGMRCMWNDGELSVLDGSGGKSLEPPWPPIGDLGCPRPSVTSNLSNQNPIAHNVAKDQWKHTYTLAGNALAQTLDAVKIVVLQWRQKKNSDSDIDRFANLHSHSQSRQQIPNSKFPCSILVLVGSISPWIKTAWT